MTSSENITPLALKPRRQIVKSRKLEDVCYDIRGPVLREANRLEEEGHRVIKLNIGNPAPWGWATQHDNVVARGIQGFVS